MASRPDEAFAAAVAAAGRPAEGEQVLPTALGGLAAWDRACAAAVREGGEPHAVVVLRTGAQGERGAGRAAAALLRSVRQHDVVCATAPGTYSVLSLCCSEREAVGLAERLAAALLDIGVGAAGGGAADPDPARARPVAVARAEEAWSARGVVRL